MILVLSTVFIQLHKLLNEVMNLNSLSVWPLWTEKASECVSSLAVMDLLRNSNIDSGYFHLIGDIYKEATAKLKLYIMSDAFSISKGKTR